MFSIGRSRIQITKEQPILEQARRRRRKRRVRENLEAEFWRHFDLEKLAVGWRNAVGRPLPAR
jgi:hypothetical protein